MALAPATSCDSSLALHLQFVTSCLNVGDAGAGKDSYNTVLVRIEGAPECGALPGIHPS